MIKLDDICKKYADKSVFEHFSFTAEDGKITVVLGESGAGKTTLLSVIAGITEFSGTVSGADKTSMVFQRDRLVPHLTVEQNVRLVNDGADVSALLAEMGIAGTEKKYPAELSAGMARRVALIRALSFDAPIVLMDEPLVNLDLSLKYLLIEKIKDLRDKYKKTVVLVTHDVSEAVMLADKIVVLSDGKIIYENDDVSENEETVLRELFLKKAREKL